MSARWRYVIDDTMIPNRKLAIATITIGGCLALAAGPNAYLVRSDAGGTALWNTNEAYFFIATDIKGRHVKWITFPFLVLGEILGNVQPADDSRGQMFVVHISRAGVERHVVELSDRRPGSGPGMYTPIEGRIWTNYPALGGLSWWARDHFEPATRDESQRFDGLNRLNNAFYQDREGWSKTIIGENAVEVAIADGIN